MPQRANLRSFAALIPHLFPNFPVFSLGLFKKRQGIIHLPVNRSTVTFP